MQTPLRRGASLWSENTPTNSSKRTYTQCSTVNISILNKHSHDFDITSREKRGHGISA